MEQIILDNIPFQVNVDELMEKLYIDKDSEDGEKFKEYAGIAQRIGKPKALYGIAYVEDKGDDYVVIDGVKFSSHVLSVNLKGIHRVFPYALTCGIELQQWMESIDDMLEQYWAGAICEAALYSATQAFNEDMEERFNPGKTSSMNPGSLEDWSIGEQKQLFRLIGDTKQLIGLELTESSLMVPIKSVSGIAFPTESNFQSCQLCPRANCPNRRAPYDNSLYKEKYKR